MFTAAVGLVTSLMALFVIVTSVAALQPWPIDLMDLFARSMFVAVLALLGVATSSRGLMDDPQHALMS